MSGLVDHRGNPYRSMKKASSSAAADVGPLDRLLNMGVQMRDDGSAIVPPEVFRKIRSQRIRDATVSRVPSTPRHMMREAGGLAVGKGHGSFQTFSLDSLRGIRESNPIIQAIHRVRAYQVRRMSKRWNGVRGKVGWRVVHRDFHDHKRDPPEGIKHFIRRFENILLTPAKSYKVNTTGDLLCPLWDDLATINRPSVEILRSSMDSRRVVGFRPIDGGIIWPTLIWLEKWLTSNPNWWVNHTRDPLGLSPKARIDILNTILDRDVVGSDYCLVREGTVESVYSDKDIIVAPWTTRTDINLAGYSPSHVEDALEAALAFSNTWEYNASYFTRGMFAEFILGISGDVHDSDITAFIDMLREASQGVRRAHQPPVMPLPQDGAIHKIDLKPNNKEMMFEVWSSLLIAFMCAGYRMDPSEINAKPWEGGGGASLNAPNRQQEITLAKEQGLQGDLGHIFDSLLTPLARTCHPDLEVICEWGDFKPQEEAALHEIQSRVSRTRNEIRRERGDLPWGICLSEEEYNEASEEEQEKHDGNPWNWPTDSVYAQAMQQKAMAKQQEEMGGEEEDDGFGGDPNADAGPLDPDAEEDGGEEEDDGFGGDPEDAGEEDGFGGESPVYPYGDPSKDMRKSSSSKVTVYVTDL